MKKTYKRNSARLKLSFNDDRVLRSRNSVKMDMKKRMKGNCGNCIKMTKRRSNSLTKSCKGKCGRC